MSCQISFYTKIIPDVQVAGARCSVSVTRYERVPGLCDGSGHCGTDQGAAEAPECSLSSSPQQHER